MPNVGKNEMILINIKRLSIKTKGITKLSWRQICVTGGTGGCLHGNTRCRPWRQMRRYDDFSFQCFVFLRLKPFNQYHYNGGSTHHGLYRCPLFWSWMGPFTDRYYQQPFYVEKIVDSVFTFWLSGESFFVIYLHIHTHFLKTYLVIQISNCHIFIFTFIFVSQVNQVPFYYHIP